MHILKKQNIHFYSLIYGRKNYKGFLRARVLYFEFRQN